MRWAIYIIVLIVVIGAGFLCWQKDNFLKFIKKDSKITSITSSQTVDSTKKKSSPKSSLIIGGDVMLARWVEQKSLSNGGWTSLFDKVRDTLKKPNCTIVNLESPIKGEKPQTQINSLIFAAKPESVEALTDGGIDAVTLANNHITDQGQAGLAETQAKLNENKIAYSGADTDANKAKQAKILTCDNVKIGLIGATYGTNFPADGVNVAHIDEITDAIKQARPLVDYLIVYPHWGTEYNASPSPYQKELAHGYIDAGADLVVGSHPHVLQPVEIYKNKTIAYSLGNLAFDQASSGKKTEGALLSINLDDKNQKFAIVPIQIESYFRPEISQGDSNSYKESLGLKDLSWTLAR